ncbi:MAG: hypothetical protein ABSB49_20800 [Polyangia bacterium]
MSTLGYVSVVRAPDEEQALLEVDVLLLQGEDFTFAQASVNAGGEDAAPALRNVVQHQRYPLWLQEQRLASRQLSLLDVP